MSDEVYPAFAAVLGGQKPTIKVRDMTSRWGVCPAQSGRSPCAPALQYARCSQIYVVVHEYCHFLAAQSQPSFLGAGGAYSAGLESAADVIKIAPQAIRANSS